MAEKFALEEFLRQAHTVDRNGGRTSRLAPFMNSARKDLFAGAALAEQKHRRSARRRLFGCLRSPRAWASGFRRRSAGSARPSSSELALKTALELSRSKAFSTTKSDMIEIKRLGDQIIGALFIACTARSMVPYAVIMMIVISLPRCCSSCSTWRPLLTGISISSRRTSARIRIDAI